MDYESKEAAYQEVKRLTQGKVTYWGVGNRESPDSYIVLENPGEYEIYHYRGTLSGSFLVAVVKY